MSLVFHEIRMERHEDAERAFFDKETALILAAMKCLVLLYNDLKQVKEYSWKGVYGKSESPHF